MEKKITKFALVVLLPLLFSNLCLADEKTPLQTQPETATPAVNSAITQNAQPQTNQVDVSNKQPANLVAPVVKEPPKASSPTKTTATKTKLDLRAVVFDPKADFSAQAKEEDREMTKVETAEYNLHEALHGEVSSLSKMSKRGMFEKNLTIYPKRGPLYSVTEYTGYRGYFTNAWSGADYQNTLYTVDTINPTIEGMFKDKRTSFRSALFFQPGKAGHDFFNDLWGDQYVQYAWSKNKNDQILVGYKRITNGIDGSMGPYTLPFMMRSQIARTYNNVRQLGVKAQGQHKMYDYWLEAGSSGRNFYAWFPGPEYSANFDVKPFGMTNGKYGNLAIGGGVTGGNCTGNGTYTVGNAFLDYEYKRWNLTLEYGSADGSNGSTGYTKNQSEGMSGTLAYRLTPRVQILGRVDQFDPNKNKKDDIRREYTIGMNYFIKDQFLKLMVNYTLYSIENGNYGSQILVGTQIIL